MNNVRKYSGQAIAIIMVVLVVATVIGASLYSRMLKNRDALISSKESTRALEQADTILDFVISSDLSTLQPAIDTQLSAGTTTYTLSEFKQSFIDTGIISSAMFNSVDDWCEDPTDDSLSIEVRMDYASLENYEEFEVGKVKAIKVGGISAPAGCTLKLGFKSASEVAELFTVKYVYAKADGNVKPYEEDDMILYCIADNIDQCDAKPQTSIAQVFIPNPPEGDTTNILSIAVAQEKLGYPLYEVRVLPLKGTIGVSTSSEGCGVGVLYNYLVRAKVTCMNDTRTKEVVVPNIKYLGYPALFDYTIYNATGVLSPN